MTAENELREHPDPALTRPYLTIGQTGDMTAQLSGTGEERLLSSAERQTADEQDIGIHRRCAALIV